MLLLNRETRTKASTWLPCVGPEDGPLGYEKRMLNVVAKGGTDQLPQVFSGPSAAGRSPSGQPHLLRRIWTESAPDRPRKQERGSGAGPETASGGERSCIRDVVAALPGGILRGLDLLTALAPQDADEAAHRMLRPARGFDNLGERRALPASSSRSPLLLVGPRFGRALLRPGVRRCVAPWWARRRLPVAQRPGTDALPPARCARRPPYGS
jgi:hypothetical protein